MMRGQRFLKEELTMMTELSYYYNEEDVSFYSNGIVLKRYDSEDETRCDFKIIADVATVYDNELRVYGASNGEDTLYDNVNELIGVADTPIPIHIVNKGHTLPEGERIISHFINSDNSFDTWALVLYESEPVLYVDYDSFNEESYKELTSVLSKLYL